jgi:endonuclease/exonuclease/phosphatase family metal-dependent hydrolase
MHLRFMSYNIQHGFDYVRKDRIDLSLTADVIRRYDSDIIGLNEVRGQGVIPEYFDQAKALADMLGYYYYFGPSIVFPERGPYGNAILSKYPIKHAEVITIPDPSVKDEDTYYETRSILKAEFDIEGCREFTVYISHFGLAKAERKNAVETLLKVLENQEKPCVFMGDLNMTPDDMLVNAISEKLKDTAVIFREPLLSFTSDKPTIKIDYMFVSNHIKVHYADIPPVVVHDHRPYIAHIEI